MSAPQTNLEKQQRRHRGPLVGMVVLVIAVGIGFVWWLGYEAAESDPAVSTQGQIDGRTGQEVPAAPSATEADPTVVQREEQSSPGVPAQTVDPQTPADIPAVDSVAPEASTTP